MLLLNLTPNLFLLKRRRSVRVSFQLRIRICQLKGERTIMFYIKSLIRKIQITFWRNCRTSSHQPLQQTNEFIFCPALARFVHVNFQRLDQLQQLLHSVFLLPFHSSSFLGHRRTTLRRVSQYIRHHRIAMVRTRILRCTRPRHLATSRLSQCINVRCWFCVAALCAVFSVYVSFSESLRFAHGTIWGTLS